MSETFVDIYAYVDIDEKDIEKVKDFSEYRYQDDDGFAEFCESNKLLLERDWEGFDVVFQLSEDGFYLVSDGYADLENAIEFGGWLIREGVTDVFKLQWSMHGADVGGGAVIIDKSGMRHVDSVQWIMNDGAMKNITYTNIVER